MYIATLNTFTLTSVVALYMAVATRWWCSLAYASSLSLVTCLDTYISCCN